MKKLSTLLAACAVAMTAGAAVQTPGYLVSDFDAQFNTGLTWTTYGIDATPSGDLAKYFKEYSATNAYNLLSAGTDYYAFSPSQFEGGEKSDEWLITPEFEVTDNEFVIAYDFVVFGNNSKNYYRICISETGEAKEDFTEIYSGNLKGGGNNVKAIERRYVLSGYQGKKVRLAFVNCDNTTGMAGFGYINVGPYYITVANANSLGTVLINESNPRLEMTVGICTAQTTPGFTAVLRTDNGFEATYSTETQLVNNKVKATTFAFENIDMMGATSQGYTVTITPNYEGAPATVVSGMLLCPEMAFPQTVLIEENTGLWCGYCTYGYAALEYYNSIFSTPGENQGNYMASAVHNGDNMTIDALDREMSQIAAPLGFNGYPFCSINRTYGLHPLESYSYVNDLIHSKTYTKGGVTRIDYDPATQGVVVNFANMQTFSQENKAIKVLAIVTENHMTGKSWAQQNYISGTSDSQLLQYFPEDALPFFHIFTEGGGSVGGLEFNDVCRAAYPNLSGEEMTVSFKAYEPVEGKLEFTLPDSKILTNVENAEINYVLLDGNTGEVLGGQRVPFADWNTDLSGVADVAASDINVRTQGGRVMIDVPQAGVAEFYTVDGRMVNRVDLRNGANYVNVNANGVVIVKVVAGEQSASAKVIVK